jgi:hypothetical protein
MIDATVATARARKLYLPVSGYHILENGLPPDRLARMVHRGTIDIGMALSERQISGEESAADTEEMSVQIARLGVLSLLQRFAIQKPGSETWFPSIANITEDRRNAYLREANRGWDVGVYSKVVKDPLTKPHLDFKVQLKTRRQNDAAAARLLAEGVTLVCLDPDLRVDNAEPFIGTRILEECRAELFNPVQDITDRLDERTDKLMEIIEV